MKTFVLSAITAAVLAAPLAAAPASAQQMQRHTETVRQQPGRTIVTQRDVTVNRGPQQGQHHEWRKGQRFDRRYASNYRVVNDYRGRHLKAPPRGYHYVQSGNDALLVGVTSGVVAAVLAGALR